MRIGPRHGPCGATDCPRCEISSNPACARLPATLRTRGISVRHPVGDSARATSEGHALECGPRWRTMASSAASIWASVKSG